MYPKSGFCKEIKLQIQKMTTKKVGRRRRPKKWAGGRRPPAHSFWGGGRRPPPHFFKLLIKCRCKIQIWDTNWTWGDIVFCIVFVFRCGTGGVLFLHFFCIRACGPKTPYLRALGHLGSCSLSASGVTSSVYRTKPPTMRQTSMAQSPSGPSFAYSSAWLLQQHAM